MDNEDNFDDLYSIIKKINFDCILLNNEGIFNIGNQKYKNYIKIFNKLYNICRKNNYNNYIKYSEKMKTKHFTESTKMNSTSSTKKFLKNNNFGSNIKEFILDNDKDEKI